MNEKRSKDIGKKASINWWKWAFVSLVSLIFIGIILLIRSIQPVMIQEEDVQEPIELKDEVSLVSTITKEDAAIIMNESIQAMIVDEKTTYEVRLDNQLEILSKVQVFNFDIPYTLFFDPYVTEDGNIQLRADAIELANFSLPVSAVMSMLANELELPSYIGIDSEEKIILIDFNELSAQYDKRITMEKIDLENNEIQLKLSLNKDTLIKGLNFNKNAVE